MYQFSVTRLLGPLSRIKLRIITKINFFSSTQNPWVRLPEADA